MSIEFQMTSRQNTESIKREIEKNVVVVNTREIMINERKKPKLRKEIVFF